MTCQENVNMLWSSIMHKAYAKMGSAHAIPACCMPLNKNTLISILPIFLFHILIEVLHEYKVI